MSHKDFAKFCAKAYTEKTNSVRSVDFLVEDGDKIKVAVAGTDDIRDLWRDAFAVPRESHRLGRGHSGFLNGGVDIVDIYLRDILRDLNAKRVDNPDGKPVIIGGHSMGGIISQAAALTLQYHGFIIDEWVGFGTPRGFSGKRDFGDMKLTSYKNGNDIVPTLLPAGLIYSHQVPLTKIGKAKRPWPNVSDHSMRQYIKNAP